MKWLSNLYNFFNTFKKEHIFLWLVIVLLLFSFLGSNMIIPQSSYKHNSIEGYSGKIDQQDQVQLKQQEQMKQQKQEPTKQTKKTELLYEYNDNIYTGIPKSQIPLGQEDLYILKSEVIPPVCPECPAIDENLDDNDEKCPPCTPCKRCPEPAFMCKEIPSDNSNPSANVYLPRPLLTDFSQFGM